MSLFLVCEDSADGILSGVYEAYLRKVDHSQTHLCAGVPEEPELFAEYVEVEKNKVYSEKVAQTVYKQMGSMLFQQLYEAMATCESDKADAVYHTIVLGITNKMGCNTSAYLTNDSVRRVMEMSQYVGREVQHLHGFLRFQELENGMLFSRIGPKNNIITFITPHFANRFRNENFIIWDETRDIYVLHRAGSNDKDWIVLEGKDFDVDKEYFTHVSPDEVKYSEYFCDFVKHIAIESRANSKLQRNMLPIRFRGYMTEFKNRR